MLYGGDAIILLLTSPTPSLEWAWNVHAQSLAKMDLEGDLPRLQEQYGSKEDGKPSATYTCDHIGVRRLKHGRSVLRQGTFVKVM